MGQGGPRTKTEATWDITDGSADVTKETKARADHGDGRHGARQADDAKGQHRGRCRHGRLRRSQEDAWVAANAANDLTVVVGDQRGGAGGL